MTTQKSKPVPRKPRADAVRNRAHILEVAKDAFTRVGAHVSLDEIAREAEVGPGTLYRHFPTREALLEAVYRDQLEKLAAAARTYAQTLEPVEALRTWMRLFVDYIAAKQIIASALHPILEACSELGETALAKIKGAIELLVARAVASGEIRADVEPMDLLRALFGVSSVASVPEWPKSAKRLVDILILGSKKTGVRDQGSGNRD